MNEYMDSRELQQMKEQLATLTKKLDKETIVNERLMRQTMKSKASSIRKEAIIESIITLIMIPYTIWVMPEVIGISTGLCCFTCFFMVLALAGNYYIHSRFRPNKFVQGNLLEVRKDTLNMKKFYINWLKIGIPFLIIFFSWFIHDIHQASHEENLNGIYYGIGFGILIGSIVGIMTFRKIQRTADEILEQIEEMNEK